VGLVVEIREENLYLQNWRISLVNIHGYTITVQEARKMVCGLLSEGGYTI